MSQEKARAAQVLKLPLILLGLMTLVTFVGPFGLKWVMMGGRETAWPPDRAVEWVALVGVAGLAAGLLTAILTINFHNLKVMKAEAERAKASAKEPR